MDRNITNKTKITIDSQKEMSKNFFLTINIIVTVISLAFLILGIVTKNNINIIFSFLLAAFFWTFYAKLVLRSFKKKNLLFDDAHFYTYFFNEDEILIQLSNHDEIKRESTIKYDEITKIKETNDYIIIYLSRLTAYPIDKSGMENNNNIIEFLNEKGSKRR